VSNLPDQFKGKRILVVEDEYFIADDTRRRLESLGASVIGPAASVARAIALIRWHKVDAAILDIKLNGETSYPVAEELERLAIPFVFASAYDRILPQKFQGYLLCSTLDELSLIGEALFGRSKPD
jgi:CheY-like chemotaxis protein